MYTLHAQRSEAFLVGESRKDALKVPPQECVPRVSTGILISAHIPKVRVVRIRNVWGSGRNLRLECSAPRWNLQNVSDPKVLPNRNLSPEQCIRVQMDALLDNDNPWPNHGLQTAYEFGLDIGGMERSKYFGIPKDLYHFDHFMGYFPSVFPELFAGFEDYSIDRLDERDGLAFGWVTCRSGDGVISGKLHFVLDKKDVGLKAGSWMTARLLRDSSNSSSGQDRTDVVS